MSRLSQCNYLFSNFTSVPMARPLKTYSREAMLNENKYQYKYQKEKWSYEMRHCWSGDTPRWKCFAPGRTEDAFLPLWASPWAGNTALELSAQLNQPCPLPDQQEAFPCPQPSQPCVRARETTVKLNALTLLALKLQEDNVFSAGFVVSVKAPSLHTVKCSSREATGKTFQNNQFVLVLMGSFSIEVLFFCRMHVCVWRTTTKKPKPQNRMWELGIPVWKFKSALLSVVFRTVQTLKL